MLQQACEKHLPLDAGGTTTARASGARQTSTAG